MGPLSRASGRLRRGRATALPRLRRVADAVRTTVRDGGPWGSLPEALATAALAPVRRSGPPSAPRPPRDWSPERAAAAERLAAAADRLALLPPRDVRVAAIADAADLAALHAACDVTAVRPEDWAAQLSGPPGSSALPDLLLVTSAEEGNGGAWTYRIGWYGHPDSLLQRDLRALVEWCAARGIPSLFAVRDRPDVVRAFGAAAALFDLVVTSDDAIVEDLLELPARRGAGVRASHLAAGLGTLMAELPSLLRAGEPIRHG